MKKIVNLLLLLGWCLLIFFFSSQNAVDSSETSSLVARFVPFLSLFWVRKLAHFIEFLVLGVLSCNVFKDYKTTCRKILMWASLFCLCYAFGDEMHQVFSDGRAPRIVDVLIDFIGSLAGIKLYLKIKNK